MKDKKKNAKNFFIDNIQTIKQIFLVIAVVLFAAIFTITTLSFTACGNNDSDDTEDDISTEAPVAPEPFNDITAAQLAANIKIGWNLGNSLDATDKGEGWLGKNASISAMETCWGNPVTTKANITAIKNAGFNAIRIPVSWDKTVDSNYKIRADWMKRVTEVVNYTVDNDLYIILNTHHDEHIFKFTAGEKTASLAAFKKIWEQIANNFKNYNEKLIFEGLNEPRTPGSGAEWSGGTSAEHAILNEYYPVFVNAVRSSGGNNGKRILMINPYAASSAAAAINALTLPNDTVSNKIIVSIHSYAPYDFALNTNQAFNSWNKNNSSDTSPITGPIDLVYNKFVSKGIPVIIGEFGAMNKNNEAVRAQWGEYYVEYAKSKGIKCFWWDNGVVTGNGELYGLLNRQNNTIYYPNLLIGLMNGTKGGSVPPGGGTTPNPVTGNMGNYRFGTQEDGVSTNYTQAVWTLTGSNLTTVKTTGAKLVLVLSTTPTAGMQLVWQGPANEIWWKQTDILGSTGGTLISGVTWNSGAKTLAIDLATSLDDYSSFKSQLSINLIIAYYGSDNINNLGIVSANLQNP